MFNLEVYEHQKRQVLRSDYARRFNVIVGYVRTATFVHAASLGTTPGRRLGTRAAVPPSSAAAGRPDARWAPCSAVCSCCHGDGRECRVCVRVDNAPPARRATPRAWRLLGESVSVDRWQGWRRVTWNYPELLWLLTTCLFHSMVFKFFLNYLLL